MTKKEFKKQGGDHLAEIREWIQSAALNGDSVTWGSDEVLQLKMLTVRDMEELAINIAWAAIADLRAQLAAERKRAQYFEIASADKSAALVMLENFLNPHVNVLACGYSKNQAEQLVKRAIERIERAEHELAAVNTALENERQKVAGCSTAALGYWKEGDSLHPDDVAKLYAQLIFANQKIKAIEKYHLTNEFVPIERLRAAEQQLNLIRKRVMGDTQCSNLPPYVIGVIDDLERELELEKETNCQERSATEARENEIEELKAQLAAECEARERAERERNRYCELYDERKQAAYDAVIRAETARAEVERVTADNVELLAALNGAMVIAECYADSLEDPEVFRSNNDNYFRIKDALKFDHPGTPLLSELATLKAENEKLDRALQVATSDATLAVDARNQAELERDMAKRDLELVQAENERLKEQAIMADGRLEIGQAYMDEAKAENERLSNALQFCEQLKSEQATENVKLRQRVEQLEVVNTQFSAIRSFIQGWLGNVNIDTENTAGIVAQLLGELGLMRQRVERLEKALRTVYDALKQAPTIEHKSDSEDVHRLNKASTTAYVAARAALAAAPEPNQPLAALPLEIINHAITETITHYRCQFQEDSEGGAYPLVDALTPENAPDISVGKEELDALIDEVCGAVSDALAAAPETQEEPNP